MARKNALDANKSDEISLNEIIEYLNGVNGSIFGEETFAPVYEFGKSIKEIDLVWAPTIEREYFVSCVSSHTICISTTMCRLIKTMCE